MEKLPLKLAIKWTNDWKFKYYIEYLNKQSRGYLSGDSIHCYYALIRRLAEPKYIATCDESISDDYTIMTIDEFFDIVGHPQVETVTDYNSDEQPKELCVQIHSDSDNHANEWALKSECKHCDYNDGFVLEDDAFYVRGGSYVISGTEHNYDIAWSEVDEEYLNTNDDYVYHGHVTDRRGNTYQSWFYSRDVTELNCEYYRDNQAIRDAGYMHSERCNEWIHEEDWDSEDHEWQSDDDDDNSDNAGYHDLSRVTRFDSSAKFTIGFEIEKEDSDWCEQSYRDLYSDTGWIKEKDGSLDDSTGYELVSPAFNLFDNRIDDEINDSRILKGLINAEYSSDCGGHINLGSSIYNTEQLFEGISGFFPLFYSMYEARMEKMYSKAKKKHHYYQKDKYSSIYIKDNVVEIRIPSAVISVTNLIWRRDLMRIIVDNINKSELQVLRMLLNQKSKLHVHLRKVYSIDRMIQKIEKFVKYSEEFNNVKLPTINTSKLQKTNKLGA